MIFINDKFPSCKITKIAFIVTSLLCVITFSLHKWNDEMQGLFSTIGIAAVAYMAYKEAFKKQGQSTYGKIYVWWFFLFGVGFTVCTFVKMPYIVPIIIYTCIIAILLYARWKYFGFD